VLLSATVAAILVLSARWLVPFLFGAGYRPAAALVLVMAPGAAMTACGQVAGDVLRGHGLVQAVAYAQWTSAACSVVLLSLLVHRLGAMGAATATTGAAAAGLAALLMKLRGLKPGDPADRDETSARAAANEDAR
jgi:O-antigen/teichoic acid export membrane protein